MRKITGHLAGNDKGIVLCRKVDPVLKTELQQLAKGKVDEKGAANKRKPDAAAAASTIVSTASTAAAGDRSRPSCSSGPDIGAKGIAAAFAKAGKMGADSKASMTIANMIHGEVSPATLRRGPR